jgi:hypothetical protein
MKENMSTAMRFGSKPNIKRRVKLYIFLVVTAAVAIYAAYKLGDTNGWNRCYRLSQTKIARVMKTGQTERFGNYDVWAGPRWKPGSPEVYVSPRPFVVAGAGDDTPIQKEGRR